jgi:hypothetical protein
MERKEETLLLKHFRNLNVEGQETLCDIAEAMTLSWRYQSYEAGCHDNED